MRNDNRWTPADVTFIVMFIATMGIIALAVKECFG